MMTGSAWVGHRDNPRLPFRVPVRPLATDAESLEGLDHRMQGEPPLFSSEGDEYGQREIML